MQKSMKGKFHGVTAAPAATESCDRLLRQGITPLQVFRGQPLLFARTPMRMPMKSLVIAGLLSALMIGRAHAQVYYTYPEWDRLSDQARTMYIAGAYDTLVRIAAPEPVSSSQHSPQCG